MIRLIAFLCMSGSNIFLFLLLFLYLHFFHESTVFRRIFIGLAEDIDRCLVKIRLMFLDDCKFFIDVLAERTAYTACSPQTVFRVASGVLNIE